MRTQLIENEQEFLQLELPWNDLHAESKGTVFQTFEWNREWWHIYRRKNYHLRVFCVWNDQRLVGILPFFLESLNIGIMKFSRLRFLGIYETYGEYSPLVHPSFEKEVAKHITSFCVDQIRNDKVDLISFFRFSKTSTVMKHILEELRSHGYNIKLDAECIKRIMMNLPISWKSYLDTLHLSEKRILNRRMRSLEKHGAELEILRDSGNGNGGFSDFVRLHQCAWAGRGARGYFASKRFEEFQREIVTQFQKKGLARLYFFQKNGIRFASVQAFFVNEQCCFYLSGLDREHELAHYSPGKVLLSHVIKDAIDEGCTVFDFQGGAEEYKFRLGGKQTAFSKAVVWKKGTKSIKVGLYLGMQRVSTFLITTPWWHVSVFPIWRRILLKH